MSTSEYRVQRLSPRPPALPARLRALSCEAWVLLALILVAVAIRVITLDNQSFWTDESLTAYEAGQSFTAMLHTVTSIETSPPLYFVLIWVWAKLFGTGEVALRSVSMLAGVAIVPIVYLSARELLDRRAGLIAAALVVVNPFMIWYSQEARAYMLLGALTGASFLWFLRARRDPSRRNLGWWAGFSAAALMTHFFGGFVVAPEALWLLWVARGRAPALAVGERRRAVGERRRAVGERRRPVGERWRATALAVGAVAAVQVAMLPFAVIYASPSRGAGWIAGSSQVSRIATTVIEWGASNLYRRVTPAEGLIGGAALGLIVVLLIVAGGDRRTRQAAKVAGAIAAFVFGAPLALGLLGQDYFLSRNEIPAFVPVVTVLAAACVAPRARAAGAALAVALLALFCFTSIDVQTRPFLQRPAWRDLARTLGPGDLPRAILAAGGTTADPLKIYLPGASWTQVPRRSVLIREIDVVGATKRQRLIVPDGPGGAADVTPPGPRPKGAAVPRSVAPPGATLVARFRFANWIVARFALSHPQWISANQLVAQASRFFRRTPATLLTFFQRHHR